MGTIVSFLVVGGLILWVLVDIHQNAKEERAKKARIQAREDKLEARADAEYEYQQALRLAELRLLEQQRINEALASRMIWTRSSPSSRGMRRLIRRWVRRPC